MIGYLVSWVNSLNLWGLRLFDSFRHNAEE